MRLRVLGSVELKGPDGQVVALSGRRMRSLMCVLAMGAGRPVSDERVFDALWPGGDGPDDPAGALRTYITRLRRAVGEALVERGPAGYRLRLESSEIDVVVFEQRVSGGLAAVRQGHPRRAETELRAALALWQGPPWQPLVGWSVADADIVRCVELHAQAQEQAAACLLAAGDHDNAVRELLALVELDPLREQRWALLMTALASVGRHADALRAYDRARRHFAEELGLDLSPRLRALETAVLNHEPLSYTVPPSAAAMTTPAVPSDRETSSPSTSSASSIEAESLPSGGVAHTAVVTVLFADLVESTALAERVGDDRADELRRAALAAMTTAVTAAGGRVAKALGDGTMATFASARRAMAAANDLRHLLRTLREDLPAIPLVRLGVSAGEASCENDDWFGRPVVEAARLCAAAAPDEALVSDVARRLVGTRGQHRFSPPRLLQLKGFAEPVPAVSLIDATDSEATVLAAQLPAASEPPMESENPAAPPHLPLPPALAVAPQVPIVGREGPLERLRRSWGQGATGRERRLVLVAGDPGIGKTRLVTELARHIHADGGDVLYGRCTEESAIPFEPFVEALRYYISAAPPDALRAALGGRRGAELLRILPELPQRLPGQGEPTRAEPDTERYLLFEAVAQVLAAASACRPLLLALDDLHWADRSTLLLLGHVVRHPDPTGLLLVGTYRETELDPSAPLAAALTALRREPVVERLGLTGLGEADVAVLVEALVGERPPVEFARSVHAETDGNPFFVREVLAHLSEVGALRGHDGDWIVPVDVEAAGGLPAGVTEVIGRRLGRLTDDTRRALGVAAVVGREFDLDVVAQALDQSPEALLDAMDAAVAARLVVETPGTIGRYGFSHALVRTALGETLTANRQAHLHRRVGEALEERAEDPSGADAAELAHHFLAAAGVGADKSVAYARAAGDHALAALAYEEAAGFFERALGVLERTQSTDANQRLGLILALGGAQRRSGAVVAARETFGVAAEAARKRGDAEAFAHAALGFAEWGEASGFDAAAAALIDEALGVLPSGDSPLRSRLLALLAWLSIFHERLPAAAGEAVAMARRIGDPALLGASLEVWHRLLIGTDIDLGERLALSEEMLGLADRSGDPDRGFWAHIEREIDLLEAGDVTALDATIESYAGLCTRFRVPGFTWFLVGWRAMRALLDGRFEEAEPLVHEALTIGRPTRGWVAEAQFALQLLFLRREQGRQAELEPVLAGVVEPPNTPIFHCALTRLHAECGHRQEAARNLAELAPGDFAAIPEPNWATRLMLAWLVEACAALGDAERAAVLGKRLRPYAGRCVWASWGGTFEGSVDRYLGLAAATVSDWDGAEAHFGAAQAMHARTGARTWAAHTDHDHARTLLARGRPQDRQRALMLLAQASATARELDMAALLERASALE